MLHSSDSRFSMGVPVSAKWCSPFSARTALETAAFRFLMYCASSSTTVEKTMPSYSATSRLKRS